MTNKLGAHVLALTSHPPHAIVRPTHYLGAHHTQPDRLETVTIDKQFGPADNRPRALKTIAIDHVRNHPSA